MDLFKYLSNNISSTERDVKMHLVKAGNSIGWLSIIWKSEIAHKKRHFFQAVVVSIILYGYSTWTMTKHIEEKLDTTYRTMLHDVSNKSWKQHAAKQKLFGYIPLISQTIQVRRARYAVCENELIPPYQRRRSV